MTEQTEMKHCKHNNRIRKMSWPDGGESWLCAECLLTKHYTEYDESEWQNHGYNSTADWYQEAANLQNSINELTRDL